MISEDIRTCADFVYYCQRLIIRQRNCKIRKATTVDISIRTERVEWGGMGNQITATAPAQILPLESYFNELTDYSKPIR